ncbi:hypothetical protein V6Z12_A09G204100 [Gossypium hirsutum]
MVAGSSKVSISSLLLARYGGARHAGMVLAEAWGVVADMVVTKDGASVRGKWGVVAKQIWASTGWMNAFSWIDREK